MTYETRAAELLRGMLEVKSDDRFSLQLLGTFFGGKSDFGPRCLIKLTNPGIKRFDQFNNLSTRVCLQRTQDTNAGQQIKQSQNVCYQKIKIPVWEEHSNAAVSKQTNNLHVQTSPGPGHDPSPEREHWEVQQRHHLPTETGNTWGV